MNPININRDGQEFGYAPEDIPPMIASGQLVATDLAWHDALPDWQPLATLPEFAAHFEAGPIQPPQSAATARYLARQEKAREKRLASQRGSGSKAKPLIIALVVLVAIVLIGGYVGLTALFGGGFETAIKENASTAENPNPALDYQVVSYQRGFLKSTAELTMVLPLMPPGFPPSPPFTAEIYHGPLLTGPEGLKLGTHRIVIRLETREIPEDAPAQFAGDEAAHLILESDLSGNTHIDLFVAGFSSLPPHDTTTFSGARGTLDTDRDLAFVRAHLEFGELTNMSAEDEAKLHLAPIVVDIDIAHMEKGTILNGTIAIDAPEIAFDQPGTRLKITDLELESDTSTTAGKLRNDFEFRLGNLVLEGEDVPLKIDGNATYAFGIRGVDAEALKRTQNSPPTKTEPPKPDAFTDVLQPGTGMSMNATVGSASGDISLNFDVEFAGERPARELATLGELVAALEANGRLRLSKSFINGESFTELVETWREEGIVADLGDKYTVTFSMKNGEPRLNGNPMELSPALEESFAEPIPWELLTTPRIPGPDEPTMLEEPADADPSIPPADAPVPEEPPAPAMEEMPKDPTDPGIPYDPTASDEENKARAEKMRGSGD